MRMWRRGPGGTPGGLCSPARAGQPPRPALRANHFPDPPRPSLRARGSSPVLTQRGAEALNEAGGGVGVGGSAGQPHGRCVARCVGAAASIACNYVASVIEDGASDVAVALVAECG